MSDNQNIEFIPLDIEPGYGISKFGQVINFRTKRILKLVPNSMGYFLFNAGRKVKLTVHREVAKIFVANPNNYPVVNHKDGDKRNNDYSNLEWVTYSENAQHAYDIGLHTAPCTGKFGKDHVASKAIIQYRPTGEVVREWENARQAEREAGFHNGRISEVCNGKSHSHRGFIFKFK